MATFDKEYKKHLAIFFSKNRIYVQYKHCASVDVTVIKSLHDKLEKH